MGGVVADQHHGTRIHQLAHQGGAVVAEPKGLAIRALLPKVEQAHVYELSREVRHHLCSDGPKGQALNLKKCGVRSAIQAWHQASNP